MNQPRGFFSASYDRLILQKSLITQLGRSACFWPSTFSMAQHALGTDRGKSPLDPFQARLVMLATPHIAPLNLKS